MSSVVLGTCALLFTVFSFWWMNWRPGRLKVAKPRSFAVMRPSNADAIVLVVPIVLVNTGALPVIVQNLRLVVPDLGGEDLPFIFQATASALAFKADHALAFQFPVRSREATTVIGEFYRTPAQVTFEAKSYEARLDGLLNDKGRWKALCSFELRVPPQNVSAVNQQGYHALDNEPATHAMLQARDATRFPPGAA
jgi:hypothetical protein